MATKNQDIKVFIGSSNPTLGKKVCDYLKIAPAKGEVLRFSEGNTFVRVLESVRGKDVYVIQGVSYPVNDNFVELLFWIDAFRLASAGSVTAIIPFFSYAKGDKKDEPRVSIRARVCADALEAAGVDRIVTVDLHSPQIQGFFKKPVDHLYARKTLVNHIQSLKLSNMVVASADVGFGKSAFKFAEALGTDVVIGNKVRADHTEQANIWSVVGDVKGKDVIIVDDIIFTGGSLIAMAQACKENGANNVYAAVTHGVLTKGAAEKIAKSQIKKLIVTDTVEYRFEDAPPQIEVASVAPVIAQAIENIHNYDSLAGLF